jgi:hypothetical protein
MGAKVERTLSRHEVRRWIQERTGEALLAAGFDDAILGVAERATQPPLVVYDAEQCIAILEKRGMTREEAEDSFSHNTLGAWVGDRTPLFLWRPR